MQYKMVQIPPNVSTQKGKAVDAAASYLEGEVNRMAKEGWEFFRVDEIGVAEQPGCLASLMGQKAVVINYYVITFRRG